MTLTEARTKSLEGGFDTSGLSDADMCLNPSFFQALGKTMGWDEKLVVRRGTVIGNFVAPPNHVFEEVGFGMDRVPGWCWYMYRMIDSLAEGKSLTEFFDTL